MRADSGFCREQILSWCAGNGVDYVVGLPRNPGLRRRIKRRMKRARRRFVETSLTAKQASPDEVHETIYRARGEMENRFKEQ